MLITFVSLDVLNPVLIGFYVRLGKENLMRKVLTRLAGHTFSLMEN